MENETENPLDGVDPFARRLIVQYVDRRKSDLEALRTALADGRFDQIRVTGHNMSGSGGAYGLHRVSEIGAHLEDAARAEQTADIRRLIDDLESYVYGLSLG